MKYSNSVKAVLKDINNIESLIITEKSDKHVFKLRTYKGNEINVDYPMFKTIGPLCRIYVAGMSISAFLNKRMYIRDEIKHILLKKNIIEKQTGDEKYTEVLTQRDEFLMHSLERVQDTINKLLEEEA